MGAPILSEEWFVQQKKLLKQSGMDKTSAASAANDVYLPSAAAEVQGSLGTQPEPTAEEKFLASACDQIRQLDPSGESFVSDAASALVGSALGQVFGEQLKDSPGYPQMHDKITRTILAESHYREVVEDFLNVLIEADAQASGYADNAGYDPEAQYCEEIMPEMTVDEAEAEEQE